MIPGSHTRYKRKDFKSGELTCARPGCIRRARHQWSAPCAINTIFQNNDQTVWVPLCDECDILMNEVMLRAFGYPEDIVHDLIAKYRMIQGDGAWS